MQRQRLVQHAPQTPDVALAVVWLVVPDLGTSIVGCSRLRVEEASLGHFGNVHVTEAGATITFQEDISRFYITMEHLQVMQFLETTDGADHDLPDLFLSELVL